jgi:glycine dehydrogenase subunit 1
MCEAVGVASLDELLKAFPDELKLKSPLDLPEGLSEQILLSLLKSISKKNRTVEEYASFLGAGAYNHYVPAVVDQILLRSEFYTAYTPYQPELSQGTLQAMFEYQTLICQLTGMDVSNASLYDGASATAEAVLMARRKTGRKKVLLSSALHPEYRETVRTHLIADPEDVGEVLYCTESATTLPEASERAVDSETACLVIQSPNFFGSIEEVSAHAEIVHKKGGVLIVAITEPLSLGLLKPPGQQGSDIAVGEGQSFGNPLGFGGPYLGFMAIKGEYLRQMPGRIVGETRDKNGARSFCLTLATREQHIRRERATSNICTNEGLSALAAAVYLCALGKTGIMELARLNLAKARYLRQRLSEVKGVVPAFSSPTFNEFVIKVLKGPEDVLKGLLKNSIIGGVPLGRFYPELSNHILLCATEMNSKQEMDRFARELSLFMGN